MSYSENMRDLIRSNQESQAKQRQDQIKIAELQERAAKDQQDANIKREDLDIKAIKTEGEVRKLDKQSQELEAKTLNELTGPSEGGDRSPAGKADPKKAIKDLDTTPPTPDQITADEGSQAPPVEEAPPPGGGDIMAQVEDTPGAGPGITPPTFRQTGTSDRYKRRLEEDLGRIPGYHKRQTKILKQQQKDAQEHQRELLNIKKRMVAYKDQTIIKMDKLRGNLKALKDNPPLRSQIMSDSHWGLKIGSAIHAGLQGYLVGLGLKDKIESVLDDMVNKEYQDQIMQWESRKEGVTDEINLLKWNFDATNDSFTAQSALRGQLWEMAEDTFNNQIAGMKLDQSSQERRLQIEGMLETIRQKKDENWNATQQQIFENEISLHKATKQDDTKSLGLALKLRKDQREQAKFEGKHHLSYKGPEGKTKTYVLSEKRKQKIQEASALGNTAVNLGKDISDVSKTIGFWDPAKAWGARLGIPASKEARKKFIKMRTLLTQYKMSIRKDVAGGQVAVAEHAMMDDILSLVGPHMSRRNIRTMFNKIGGDYEVVGLMLKRRAVQSVVSELLESKIGASYVRKHGRKKAARLLFIQQGRKMGLSNNELRANILKRKK